MVETRSGNAIRNIFFSIINKIVSIILPFFVKVLFIRIIGSELMGLNSLFVSILQVLNLTELGFNDAVVFAMYRPVAENDKKTISDILLFYKKVYQKIGLIILFIGLCLTPFIDLFINNVEHLTVNIYLIFLLYLFNTVISYLFSAYKGALLTAYQRVDITSKISIIVKLIINFGQAITIFILKDIYFYVSVLLVGTVINNILIYISTKKIFPDIEPKGNLSKEKKIIIYKKLKGLILYKLCLSSRNSFDSIFISMFVGLTATAIYNNYFYILGAVAAFSSAITESILPGVGNSIVKENQAKNYSDMNKINFIYLWFAGFCTICMINIYQPFTELAFGKENLFPFAMAVMFSIYYYVLRMGDIRAVYSDAHGLWWENRYRLVLETLTNIILNYVLGKNFGVYGILLATLISLFIFGFAGAAQVLFRYYFTDYKLNDFFIFNLKMGSVTIFTGIVISLICSLVRGDLIIVIILRCLICIIFINIIFYFINRHTQHFKEAYAWIYPRLRGVKLR